MTTTNGAEGNRRKRQMSLRLKMDFNVVNNRSGTSFFLIKEAVLENYHIYWITNNKFSSSSLKKKEKNISKVM